MADSVKLSSKHQIVVPKAAREALGLRAGDRLLVSIRADGVVELEKQPPDLEDRLEGALHDVVTRADDWPEIEDA
ncbi:MAG: AbrB/MazE/SpoVT family DNA-binding domain-containing protein [Gemmatimonadota bacterium]